MAGWVTRRGVESVPGATAAAAGAVKWCACGEATECAVWSWVAVGDSGAGEMPSAAVEETALPLLPLRLMSEGEDAAEDGLDRVGLAAMAPAATDAVDRAPAAAALESRPPNGLARGEMGWVGGSAAAWSRDGDGEGARAAKASLVCAAVCVPAEDGVDGASLTNACCNSAVAGLIGTSVAHCAVVMTLPPGVCSPVRIRFASERGDSDTCRPTDAGVRMADGRSGWLRFDVDAARGRGAVPAATTLTPALPGLGLMLLLLLSISMFVWVVCVCVVSVVGAAGGEAASEESGRARAAAAAAVCSSPSTAPLILSTHGIRSSVHAQ